LERNIKDLENEVSRLEKVQIAMTKEQENLRLEIFNKNDNIRFAEQTLNDNRKTILHLEGDISELKKINARTRDEIAQHSKNQQNEFGKNLEATNRVNKLDDTIRARDEDVADLKAALAALKQKHEALLKHNDDLNHDIEVHTKHLETLSIQNHELVAEIDHYHNHDEKVRSSLEDRQNRVSDVKDRHDDKMAKSINFMKSSLKSPNKPN